MKTIPITTLPRNKGVYSFKGLKPPFILDYSKFPEQFNFEKQMAEIRIWMGDSIVVKKQERGKLIFEYK